MSVRAGMTGLITKVRALTYAGTADFSVAGEDYFSDEHIQDILDANVTQVEDHAITWLQETIEGSTASWTRAVVPYRDTEGTVSGTDYWVLRNSSGSVATGYEVNHNDGMIRFTSDQSGTGYYLTARSYDIYSAAADVWARKAGFYADWYDFTSDDQRFARQQAYEHAVTMEEKMRQRAGQNLQRGAMKSGMFQRTDMNEW